MTSIKIKQILSGIVLMSMGVIVIASITNTAETTLVERNGDSYLVQDLGYCGEYCHTPRNFIDAMKSKYYLTGSFIDGFWAFDINDCGFKTASTEEVTKVFLDNHLMNQTTSVYDPMVEINLDSLQYVTPEDLQTIVICLKSLHNSQSHIIKQKQANIKIKASTVKQYKFQKSVLKMGQKVYATTCAICHDSGMENAPKVGDSTAWALRLQKGIPILYQHTINGFNQMPPKGSCANCTDDEIRAAVDYIIDNSQKAS